MGFGLLFLGFLLFLSFKIFPVGVIGAALMYAGLSKLCKSAPYFSKVRIPCAVYFVYSVLFAVLWTFNITGALDVLGDGAKLLWIVDDAVYTVIFCIFCDFLFKALKRICEQVGFDKGVKKYRLCLAFLEVYALGSAVKFVCYPLGYSAYVTAPLLVVELLTVVSAAAWLYSCYMMIATQEIIDDETEKIRKYDKLHSKKR